MCTQNVPNSQNQKNVNFMAEGQQDKTTGKKKKKKLMIISYPPPFFIYIPHTPNMHKRLFHQICTHSPFCYQDELLMCLSAAPQMCKVRRHHAHLQKNALPQTDVLISDAFSPSSELTKKCNFKLESGLTRVKTSRNECAKVNIRLS